MKHVLEISEVLGVQDLPRGPCEILATGTAEYDPKAARLRVRLNSCLRTTNLRAREEQFAAAWLPQPQTVVESARADEAADLAREIFHRWVRKVRNAAPAQPAATTVN